MKKFTIFLIICIMILASCSDKNNITYTNDVDIKDLSTKITSEITLSSIIEADENWIALNLPINTTLCDEYIVNISIDGKADIIGLFKANSEENAYKLLEQTNSYLDLLKENWLSEYSPEELPKIESSISNICGNYVYFIVLDDTNRETTKQIIEDELIITQE